MFIELIVSYIKCVSQDIKTINNNNNPSNCLLSPFAVNNYELYIFMHTYIHIYTHMYIYIFIIVL